MTGQATEKIINVYSGGVGVIEDYLEQVVLPCNEEGLARLFMDVKRGRIIYSISSSKDRIRVFYVKDCDLYISDYMLFRRMFNNFIARRVEAYARSIECKYPSIAKLLLMLACAPRSLKGYVRWFEGWVVDKMLIPVSSSPAVPSLVMVKVDVKSKLVLGKMVSPSRIPINLETDFEKELGLVLRLRAEEYSVNELLLMSQLYPVNSSLITYAEPGRPAYIYGARGSGKTFTILASLLGEPALYMRYLGDGRIEVWHPRMLMLDEETPEYDELRRAATSRSPAELERNLLSLSETTYVVMDDIHYMLEEGYVDLVVKLLELAYNMKARVIIVADEPMTKYVYAYPELGDAASNIVDEYRVVPFEQRLLESDVKFFLKSMGFKVKDRITESEVSSAFGDLVSKYCDEVKNYVWEHIIRSISAPAKIAWAMPCWRDLVAVAVVLKDLGVQVIHPLILEELAFKMMGKKALFKPLRRGWRALNVTALKKMIYARAYNVLYGGKYSSPPGRTRTAAVEARGESSY